ncbi:MULTISPECIES: hypothetical protein [Streptomyces]|uniref:Uncharacterized protein n=1 Tax=Streptomyces gougerotii TaxID=53448 RepID=A0A8H9HAY9_9ACTN|nr:MULTISPECIES: hypothetical protein [Streptomyces]GFH68915.1 hypothetical protein Srut_54290 [Streptomyces rutgersensis]GFH79550.1 hypothetical protein Sgou_42200 [Streptomyces gougerotii]GGU52822.1 hypothetical protein GCM10010227_01990 [Streptomyces gougerotii]
MCSAAACSGGAAPAGTGVLGTPRPPPRTAPAARLAELDDADDMGEYDGPTAAELDAETTAEARRPAAGP